MTDTRTGAGEHRTASQVVRDLMREYIDRHQRVDDYAAFLSAKVERARARARAQAAAGCCAAAAAGRRVLPKLADPKRLLSTRVATSVIAAWKAKARGG